MAILMVSASVVFGDTHYVSGAGSNAAPYTSWASAAHEIQSAVDEAQPGDFVLVAAGTYQTGSRQNSRIVVNKAVEVRSVDGRGATTIVGDDSPAVRCAYLSGAGAVLRGFTLSSGETPMSDYDGGGAYVVGGARLEDCVVENCTSVNSGAVFCNGSSVAYACVIRNNSGYNGGATLYKGGLLDSCEVYGNSTTAYGSAGGVMCFFGGEVRNSIVRNNTASRNGNGILCHKGGTVRSCTVVNNTGGSNGGVYVKLNGRIYNSIVYGNGSVNIVSDNDDGGEPDPILFDYRNVCSPEGVGTSPITGAPDFVNQAAYDFSLKASSPCLDAGSNALVVGTSDIDGFPRVFADTVDVGAHEANVIATELTIDAGQVSAEWRAVPGGTFRIEWIADLRSKDWSTLDTHVDWPTPVITSRDTITDQSRRFYRVVWER
jgi:hypothetical protein